MILRVLVPIRWLPLTLVFLPLTANSAPLENGTWSSQIKESSTALVDASCSYGGFHDADAMVTEFNASKHSVWMAPVGPVSFTNSAGVVTRFTDRCSWKNLERVAQKWNTTGSCVGCNPTVYAVMNNEELGGTDGLSHLATYAAQLSSFASGLTGSTPVRFGVSVDDAQGLFRTTLKSNGAFSISDFESTYMGIKAALPQVEISPYFEAAIAMSLVGDTYRMGIPSGPDDTYRFNKSGSVSMSFSWKSGIRSPIVRIPEGARIEFPIADLYLNQDSTRKLEVLIETSADGGTTWTNRSTIDLTDPPNTGTRIHGFSYSLSSDDRTAIKSALFKLRITLRGAGSNNTVFNANKMILLGSPMIEVPSIPFISIAGFPGVKRYSFSELARTYPALFTLTSDTSSAMSVNAIANETPVAEKLLDKGTETRRIDGIFFKTDSNPAVFDPTTEALIAENVCSTPKLLSLPCRSVTWGSSLQGTATLSPETEASRYIATSPYITGSVSYNYPLDLAVPGRGILTSHLSSSGHPNSLGIFLWPLETRGVEGFTRRWQWRVPADYPSGQPSQLIWRLPDSRRIPATSCTAVDASSGTALSMWRFDLEGSVSGPHPQTQLKTSSGQTASFIPVPGETITLQLHPMSDSVGNTLCYAEAVIETPSGYSPASGTFLESFSDTATSISDNANELYNCIRYLYQNPTVSSFSSIPSGTCPR